MISNMEEIFIVFGCHDDYECCDFPITFRLTESDASEEVGRLIEHQVKVMDAQELIRQHYRKLNEELGEVVCGAYKQRKKWPAGIGEKDITKEMRDERDSYDEYNEAVELDYMKRYNAKDSKCKELAEEYSRTLGLDEEIRKKAFEMNWHKTLYSYRNLINK